MNAGIIHDEYAECFGAEAEGLLRPERARQDGRGQARASSSRAWEPKRQATDERDCDSVADATFPEEGLMEVNRLQIPATDANAVTLRFSPLPRTGSFNPPPSMTRPFREETSGWWLLSLPTTPKIPAGVYEYDITVVWKDGRTVAVPDPFAEEITKYAGYRGVLRIDEEGKRYRTPFDWGPGGDEALRAPLPANDALVIYELPMRWVDAPFDAGDRQVGLGTFDKAAHERLEYIAALGVTAIELLPIQDSPDTLNWGYGTRFFFAPDLDMAAEPYDVRAFVKACHDKGIRVIMDVVMNHAKSCPLRELAFDRFFLKRAGEEPLPDGTPRKGWGGDLFRYARVNGDEPETWEFHKSWAEYWIREYHVDGLRLDEFVSINSWDFIRNFSRHVHEVQRDAFPGRPMYVVAEDSWRRAHIADASCPGGQVVDASWDFTYQEEVRKLIANRLWTRLGKPGRKERTDALLRGHRLWVDDQDPDKQKWRDYQGQGGPAQESFRCPEQRVTYATSHDVEAYDKQRLLPYLTAEARKQLQDQSWYEGIERSGDALARSLALDQVVASFAILMTSVGVPMFLAGEEFAELHDLDNGNWRTKASDKIDWGRSILPGHRDVLARVRDLVQLRKAHLALRTNELKYFGVGCGSGFSPTFDEDDGERVFCYCRTTRPEDPGGPGQVAVVANLGPRQYASLQLDWPWGPARPKERGGIGQAPPSVTGILATLEVLPFQVRVFEL